MTIKTAGELKREFSFVKALHLPKTEKVPLVKAIREGISRIEMAAIKDMAFPFAEVYVARELLAHVDKWLEGAGVEV